MGHTTRIDFKDRFFIGSTQKQVKLILPTQKEMEYYKHAIPKHTNSKVVIIVNHYRCDWGNCPNDYITVEGVLPPPTPRDENDSIRRRIDQMEEDVDDDDDDAYDDDDDDYEEEDDDEEEDDEDYNDEDGDDDDYIDDDEEEDAPDDYNDEDE